jgi:hypothetical protein
VNKVIVILFFIILLAGKNLPAQNPYIQNYTTTDGLPSNTVYPIIKDSKNFLWFGTNAGVARYDGSRFTCFSKKDGLSCNDVIVIKEDLQGRIWFFNFNGTMNYFYQNKIYNHLNAPFLDSLKTNQFWVDFFQDTDSAIYFYSYQSNEIASLNNQNQVRIFVLPGKTIIVKNYETIRTAICLINKSPEDGILLWTSSGIYALKDFSEGLRLISDKYRFSSFYKLNTNKYLFQGRSKSDNTLLLFKFSDNTLSAPVKDPINYKRYFASAIETDDRVIWIATIDRGIFCLQNNSIINHIDIKEAQGLVQDHEGNIWVSTTNKGIFKISPYYNSIKHLGPELFNHSGVIKLHSCGDEGIWMTNGNQMYLLKEKELYSMNFSQKESRFDQIYYLKNKTLVIGKDSYFFYQLNDIVPIKSSKQLKFSSLCQRDEKKGFKAITISKISNKIAAFGANHLYLFSNEGISKEEEAFYVGERIHNIFYNIDDELVVNARKNYVYRDGKLFPYQQLSEFDNEIITDYLQINDSVEAINVDGDNIYLLCKNRICNLTEAMNKTIDSKIVKMVYHKNSLYLAASQNIFICNNPENIHNTQTVDLRIIDVNFDNISDLLVFKDSLYVASDDGLTIIPEAGLTELKTHIPIPYFQSVQINGKETNLTSNELFLTGKNRIRFSFGCINYSSSPIIYSYQLEGLDENWVTETAPEVVYQNLAAGNYIFRVKAQKPGTEFSAPLDFKIHISATIWQQPLFYTGILILIIGWILWSVHRRQLRRRMLLEMDNQLLILEQKALQSMMNPHFIFNVLGSIQHYLINYKPDDAGLYLSQFARLIRQNLNAINSNMISVEEEVDRLRNYLDLERLRMKNTFEYTIDFEETDAEDELLIPSMIIQPYVENAVWHGISTCGNEGMIKITFKIHEQNTVRITVEDNGPGIKNVPLQTSKSQQHLNMGTNITRKRLEILGKKHGVKTTIEYEETFPGNPNPGTRVVLVVPLFYSRE